MSTAVSYMLWFRISGAMYPSVPVTAEKGTRDTLRVWE